MNRQLPVGLSSLLLALFSVLGFAILAQSILEKREITHFDEQQADRCFRYCTQHPHVWQTFDIITQFGGRSVLWPLSLMVVLLLILDRQWAVALIWMIVQLAQNEAVKIAKVEFGRSRPCWNDEICKLMDLSFPSGHACAAMTIYGMLAYLVLWRWPAGRWRWCVVGILGILILAIGASRMMLGVHYFSDVVGGFLLGLAWVMLAAAVLSRIGSEQQQGQIRG